jgi:hypothetical protein
MCLVREVLNAPCRFVHNAGDNSSDLEPVTFADPADPSQTITASVPRGELNADLFDAAFTRPSGEGWYPGGPVALAAAHRIAAGAPLGARWAHKYALDLDGAGYSGAFLALLESDSAVLKPTLYAEFWSGTAVPWLHYVPLSTGMRELYALHAYFSGPSPAAARAAGVDVPEGYVAPGDRALRRIARAGKQWRRTAARAVDMEGVCLTLHVRQLQDADAPTAYVYRLCLEYARLWADDRAAMDFVLSQTKSA